MKKLVSLLVLVVFLVSCMSSIALAESVNASYDNAKKAVSAIVSSLEAVTDPVLRAQAYSHYLTYYIASDAHMDELIALVKADDMSSIDVIATLNAAGIAKKDMIFLFQLVKSVPEASRAEAVEAHISRTPQTLTAEEIASFERVFDELVSAEFQATIEEDYGLTAVDFYPFFKTFDGLFIIKTEEGRLVVDTISPAFAEALGSIIEEEDIDEINGIAITQPEDLLQAIVSEIEENATEELVADFKTVLESVNAYADITFNDAIYVYDGTEKTILVNATLPEGVTVTYESNKATEPGRYTAKATFSGGEYDNKELTATLIIAPKPEDISVKYKVTLTLSKVTDLPEGWEWKDPSQKVKLGKGVYTAVFTDEPTGLTITKDVNVNAKKQSSNGGVVITPPAEEEKVTFTDIDGHWAEANIITAAEKGYFNGYEDGSFAPNNGVTRQEMAVVLVRVLGLTEKLGTAKLQNISDEAAIAGWAAPSVALLLEMGIITGYEDGSFKPEVVITREQLCTILARALTQKPATLKDMSFTDYSEWAKDYVQTMYTLGVVEGFEDGTFRGTNSVTRAEAATMLLRYAK